MEWGHGGSIRSLGGAILCLEGSFLERLFWQLLLYLLNPSGIPKGLIVVLRLAGGLGLGESQKSRHLWARALVGSTLLQEGNFLGQLQLW